MPTETTGWRCTTCGFVLFVPVPASLSVSQLGLYNDARFPGRSIVVLNRHVAALEDLADSERNAFWADATTVGRAVKRVTGCARVNYAVLGNAEPHLHVHVIPRRP